MQCPRCQAENDPEARFCEECGARLEQACPTCGQPATLGKSFCRSCGASLTTGAARFPAPESYTPKHLGVSADILTKIHAENELALAYAGYGRFYRQIGRFAEARDYLTRALEIFERLGTIGEPDRVREASGQAPTV